MKLSASMDNEFCFIDNEGNVSDEQLHDELLENQNANDYADSVAYRMSLDLGIEASSARRMFLGPDNPYEPEEQSRFSDASLGQSAVRERQIDFILHEEFSLGNEFLKRFFTACSQATVIRPAGEVTGIYDVRASVRDQYSDASSGETDVLVRYFVENETRPSKCLALLVENKISAAYQPMQAERYKLRGEMGIKLGFWEDYLTCLVAPKAYIREGHGFQLSMALEDLVSLLAPDSDMRRQFRKSVIDSAIHFQSLSGLRVPDVSVTTFRKDYYQAFLAFSSGLASEEDAKLLANLKTSAPRDAYYGDTWFTFKASDFKDGVYITHKAERGAVDLTFPNTKAEELMAKLSLLPGMKIEPTGKSSSVRLSVRPIEHCIHFSTKLDAVKEAFKAVVRLYSFYVQSFQAKEEN